MSLLPASPKETLLALINANNSLPIPLDDAHIYFGQGRIDTDGITTILPSVGMLGTEYTGYADFRYRRTNLSVAYDQVPDLHSVGDVSLYKMLPIINRFLGLNLSEDDVVDTDVSTVGQNEQVNINVVTKPGSLGYTGQFTLRFFRKKPFIWRFVPVNEDLTVLALPSSPSAGKKNLDMLMWNVDFSNSISDLAVTSGNTWKSQAAVKALMTFEFGFTDFPAPVVKGVTDYATTSYPGANTAYDRVVVQKSVVGGTYQGNALFHYNLS